jgi:hypothetical protein
LSDNVPDQQTDTAALRLQDFCVFVHKCLQR